MREIRFGTVINVVCLSVGAVFFLFLGTRVAPSYANALNTPGNGQVTGTVRDSRRLPLGGALVHFAMRSRGTTTTVIAKKDGTFGISLDVGSYSVSPDMRGYSGADQELAVRSGEKAAIQMVLKPVTEKLDLEGQINGAELLSVLPASKREAIVARCTGCHSPEVLGGKRMTRQGWDVIVKRMAGQHPTGKGNLTPWVPSEEATWDQAAEAIANFFGPGKESYRYDLFSIANTVDRLSKVVIKEFELPRKEIYTHDVAADASRDRIWYGDQAANDLSKKGKFGWYDPATGESKEYEVPQCVGLDRILTDKRGRIWVGCGTAIAYWDPKEDKPVIFPLDADGMHGIAVDSQGILWLPLLGKSANNNQDQFDYLGRFDPQTRQWTKYKIPTPLAGAYETQIDSKDNVWFTEIIADKIGKRDAKTGKITEYAVPTKDSAPRRFGIDSKDNIWFVEFLANKLSVLDPQTGKITEYEIPTPMSFPYACSIDRNDLVWFSEITGNRIGRFDPKTKTFREYPIPSRVSGIKKLDFTYSDGKEIVWGGYRIGAKVVRFEIPND